MLNWVTKAHLHSYALNYKFRFKIIVVTRGESINSWLNYLPLVSLNSPAYYGRKLYLFNLYHELQQQQQRLTSPLIFRLSNLSDKRSSLVRIAIFRTVIKLFVAKSPLPCSFSSRLCIQLVQISICHLVHQSYSKLAFLFHLFECRLSSSRYLFLSCDTKTANK